MNGSQRRLLAAAATLVAGLALAGPAQAEQQQGLALDWQACGAAGAQCATAAVPKDYDNPRLGTLDRRGREVAGDRSLATASARCSSTSAARARGRRPTSRSSGPGCSPCSTSASTSSASTRAGARPLDCMANQETDGVYSKPFTTPDTVDVRRSSSARTRATSGAASSATTTSSTCRPRTSRATSTRSARRSATSSSATSGSRTGRSSGATIQSLFPGKTRAVVLDGALDPDQYMNDPLGSLDEQTAGFERAISRFLSQCAAHPDLCRSASATSRATVDD